ncbi:hypothetical protein HNO89_003752 [Sporosarcina luteola]|nr:hypothetical protein [Sporosarcina luteola]
MCFTESEGYMEGSFTNDLVSAINTGKYFNEFIV